MSGPLPFARRVRTALATAVVCAAAGCGVQVADLPVPGYGVSGPTYTLRIEFASVLNLPQGAKVISDGVRVGQLTDLRVVTDSPSTGYVLAELAIMESVRLPVGTTAELRQETPLGDVHIALSEPAAATSQVIEPGATIPLADTTGSATIEDILAALSVFVGSGAITDVQDIIRKMNTVLPRDPRDTARIAGTLGADLTDLADNIDSVDALLDGMQATLEQGVIANAPVLEELLTPFGVQQTTDVINAQIGVIFVLTALGPVAPSTLWLAPLLQSLDDTAVAVVPMLFGARPLDTNSPSNMRKLVDLIHTEVVPFVERGPKVDITEFSVTGAADRDEQTRRVIDILRMIGAVR
ncbi:MlaD family protein [Nocardia sp. NPDC004654]|uniref:MlaD family protein n=1 Tax=Nocardia sp. NPDC004654 TaxID=3154776 RepID=UPI0033AD50FA